MFTHYVGSEVGRLRRVMLHRPNLSLQHLTPSNCQELLFDDVLSVERAGKEHDIFADTLRKEDVEVLLLTTLLTETLAIDDAKEWLLTTQVSGFRLGPTYAEEIQGWLRTQPNQQLARILTGGLTFGEVPAGMANMVVNAHAETDFIINPLPNHLFTRDTSCWIYNGVSINPMAKEVRRRESDNLRAIYRWHPLFAQQPFVKYFDDRPMNYDNATIEGGDVLVIGRGTVLIGMSERTTPQGVELLAQSLFTHRQAKRVMALQLPKHRSCMHLDTVFTQLDINKFSVYPAVVKAESHCWNLQLNDHGTLQMTEEPHFLHALAQALDVDHIELIATGGDPFEAEREQWNDANNVLAVRPGVVIGYERNTFTNEKYDKAGITVLAIPGDELGRGRGGARCMSCPLQRDDI